MSILRLLGTGGVFDYCHLVGSRAMGCATNDSDYDFIVPDKFQTNIHFISRQCIENHLNIMGIEFEKNNYGTLKVSIEIENRLTIDYNFIFLDDRNFAAWKEATELMKCVTKVASLSKRQRCKIFSNFVVLKGGDKIKNAPSF